MSRPSGQNSSKENPILQPNPNNSTPLAPEDLDKFGPLVARLGELLARSIMWWKLRRMRKQERKRLPGREKFIAVVQQRHKDAKDRGLVHYECVYNVTLYVAVLDYDIAIISRYYSAAYRTWEKKFAARQLAVLLYEASEDLPQLLGKDFRTTLRELPLWNEAVDELNAISSQLHAFDQANHTLLKQLRLFVGAHRDRDAGKQMEVIENIDPFAIYNVAADLYISLNLLIAFLFKVVNVLGRTDVMITHILKTPEFSKPRE